jgi:molybdopterin synthase sulfur carrier subunit
MKIILELFGASRDFSDKGYIDFEIPKPILIKDFRKVITDYLNDKFNGNTSFLKIVKNSAFCSEENEIISDNYKITKSQKISIIPPIGGG